MQSYILKETKPLH